MLSSEVMTPRVEICRLEGPVTVTYRTEGGRVYARALQFDLVGIGKTKEEALRELQELFSDYVEEFLYTKGRVQFSHPADAAEWDNPSKEFYAVILVFTHRAGARALPPSVSDPGRLRRLRGSIEAIQLQPLACA